MEVWHSKRVMGLMFLARFKISTFIYPTQFFVKNNTWKNNVKIIQSKTDAPAGFDGAKKMDGASKAGSKTDANFVKLTRKCAKNSPTIGIAPGARVYFHLCGVLECVRK